MNRNRGASGQSDYRENSLIPAVPVIGKPGAGRRKRIADVHMTEDYPPKTIHISPCIEPSLACCEHRFVATGREAQNVIGKQVWCGKWRENRMKDKVWHYCQPEYHVKEPAVIDAEEQQRNRFKLRDGR